MYGKRVYKFPWNLARFVVDAKKRDEWFIDKFRRFRRVAQYSAKCIHVACRKKKGGVHLTATDDLRKMSIYLLPFHISLSLLLTCTCLLLSSFPSLLSLGIPFHRATIVSRIDERPAYRHEREMQQEQESETASRSKGEEPSMGDKMITSVKCENVASERV